MDEMLLAQDLDQAPPAVQLEWQLWEAGALSASFLERLEQVAGIGRVRNPCPDNARDQALLAINSALLMAQPTLEIINEWARIAAEQEEVSPVALHLIARHTEDSLANLNLALRLVQEAWNG